MRSSVDTACSGSSEEIKIGAGVLDYISELGNIQAKILEAYTYSEQCVQNIESEDTYQGEAREEMLAFFKSLASNMQKMTFLYQAAGALSRSTVGNTYGFCWIAFSASFTAICSLTFSTSLASSSLSDLTFFLPGSLQKALSLCRSQGI